jgi:hypothetical protein
MRKHRRSIVGMALLAALGLAIAGCGGTEGSDGSDGPGGTDTAAVSADPKQALADSVKAIAEGNFKFTGVDHESTMSGSVHAPSKSAQMQGKATGDEAFEIGAIIIDQDRWIKMKFGPELAALIQVPDKWLHLDPAKVTNAELLKEMSVEFGNAEKTDPAGAGLILDAVVTAEKAGDGEYTGTVDLTKATDAGMLTEDVVTDLADKAKAVPFTASLDGQGRLTRLTLDMPAAGEVAAHKAEVKYSDYGAATAAKEPPSGEAQEAPARLYELLNSA